MTSVVFISTSLESFVVCCRGSFAERFRSPPNCVLVSLEQDSRSNLLCSPLLYFQLHRLWMSGQCVLRLSTSSIFILMYPLFRSSFNVLEIDDLAKPTLSLSSVEHTQDESIEKISFNKKTCAKVISLAANFSTSYRLRQTLICRSVNRRFPSGISHSPFFFRFVCFLTVRQTTVTDATAYYTHFLLIVNSKYVITYK